MPAGGKHQKPIVSNFQRFQDRHQRLIRPLLDSTITSNTPSVQRILMETSGNNKLTISTPPKGKTRLVDQLKSVSNRQGAISVLPSNHQSFPQKQPLYEGPDVYHKPFNESCSVASINDNDSGDDNYPPVVVEIERRKSKFTSLSPASKPPLYRGSLVD